MKKIVCLLLTAVMLLGCVAALASCASKDDGAVINVYLGNEICDFDPTDYYVDSNAEEVMGLLFDTLFTIDEDGDVKCSGAKKYDVIESKRQIVITLRESYWSDGVRVKASDYIYAWCERLLNPNNPNPAAALLYDVENAIAVKDGSATVADVGAIATDVFEITITYRYGADYEQLIRNLASVATAAVKQDAVALNPNTWSKNGATRVFNGPFTIDEYDHETGEFTLVRNIGYHQGLDEKNYTDEVIPGKLVSFFTANGDAIVASYADIESKAKFYVGDASLADRVANKDKAVVADDTSVYTYVFNTKKPLFSDSRVRKALSVAIDRNAIIAAITFGKAANGFIPDVSGGSSAALISASSDVAAAEALLAEVDLSSYDKRFTLAINNDEESRVIAEIVKASWEALGFDIEIVYLENVVVGDYYDSGVQVAVKEASFANYDFDVLAVDWQTYSNDAFVGLSSMTTKLNGCGVDFSTGFARNNITGWSNIEYDELINAAYKTSDGAKRAQYLADAEELLVESSPIVPLVFNQSFAFIGEDLSDVYFDGFGNICLTEADLKNYENYLPNEE